MRTLSNSPHFSNAVLKPKHVKKATAKSGFSIFGGPPGSRTPHQRIMSPLL